MFAIGAVSFDTPEDAKHYVPLPPAAEELGSREDARSAGRHVGTPSGRTDTWKKTAVLSTYWGRARLWRREI